MGPLGFHVHIATQLVAGTRVRASESVPSVPSPASLRTCVLLDKPSRRSVQVRADHVGFSVPDAWIIGYGLDSAGLGRGLPYVAEVVRDDEVKPAPR